MVLLCLACLLAAAIPGRAVGTVAGATTLTVSPTVVTQGSCPLDPYGNCWVATTFQPDPSVKQTSISAWEVIEPDGGVCEAGHIFHGDGPILLSQGGSATLNVPTDFGLGQPPRDDPTKVGCDTRDPGTYEVELATNLGTFTGSFVVLAPKMTLTASSTHVWANGRQTSTLTAALLDQNGQSLPPYTVTLSGAPDDGVAITDASGGAVSSLDTDSSGHAVFEVSSTRAETVTFTADNPAAVSGATSSVQVTFGRHAVVVQFLGINTELECASATGGSCSAPDDLFGGLRSALPAFQPQDFLWFSYRGGTIDPGTGEWRAFSYSPADTARGYSLDVAAMQSLLLQFAAANPNTDFYLVGHSQGGFVAFQELGYLNRLPATAKVKAIITFDSPLGGAPAPQVSVATLGTSWTNKAGPAPSQQVKLYNTTSRHGEQGSTAALLCSDPTIFGSRCPDFSTTVTNGAAVAATAASGVSVMTLGSSDDGVYNPAACGVHLAFLSSSNTSSQIVEGASGGLFRLDHDTPLQPPITLGAAAAYAMNALNPLTLLVLVAHVGLIASCVTSSHHAALADQTILGRVTPVFTSAAH
jgi:pimeloyl-ACP methyl ester carboxylesterase